MRFHVCSCHPVLGTICDRPRCNFEVSTPEEAAEHAHKDGFVDPPPLSLLQRRWLISFVLDIHA